MTDLWELINQKLHAIVDRALNARSLALYDGYLRDVEAYVDQVEDSAARMYAGAEANKRRLTQYEAEIVSMDARVDELILAGDDDAARMLQADLDAKRELAATTRAQIANQEADYRRLLAGREESKERLELMRGERPAVESLMAVIRAGQLVESIELTLGSLAQLGRESAIGEIAAGIQRRLYEAEARWQMAAASLEVDRASVEAEKAQVEDQLAERVKRLGLDEGDAPE